MSILRIIEKYNPEFDISPIGPHVTWAEYTLALKLQILEQQLKMTQQLIRELRDRLEEADD